MIKFISTTLPDFEYYQKGNNPTLLIHTGTHGDEYDVIDLVKNALEKYEDKLPEFLFVPKVSPSAVKLKTRKNSDGVDLNRNFYNDSKMPEVIENINLMKKYKFDMFVSIHEDPEFETYYIYDQTFVDRQNVKVLNHNKFLKDNGIKLLNGVDDPKDLHLGYEFVEGYKMFIDDPKMESNGATTVWAMSEGMCNEALTPEIPGIISLKEKEFIVDSFFTNVLL